VVVTGAASGIGAATARRLVAEGARVGLVDIDLDGAKRVAGEMDGVVAGLDLASLETIPPAMEELVGELEGIDLVVNCAGWDKAMSFEQTDASFWRKVIDINLVGPIALTHAALPHVVDGGAIVNV